MGAHTCTVGACSRLSDIGEGAKENRKAREKRGGVGRARASLPLLSFLPLFFSCLRFLNSADQTI